MSSEGRTRSQGKGKPAVEVYRSRGGIELSKVPTYLSGTQHVIAASRVNNPNIPESRVNHRNDYYVGGLYRAPSPAIIALPVPATLQEPFDSVKLVNFLREQKIEAFHLHWPEWFLSDDINQHLRFIDCLHALRIPTIWTLHNLKPHSNNPKFIPIYRAWAATAAAAIHHSNWGMNRVRREYDFPACTLHSLIPHGHNGHAMQEAPVLTEPPVNLELGMAQCDVRLGIIGNPRQERCIQMAMDAFAASRRNDLDLQLAVFSLGPDHRVPDDPRIYAWPYSFTERETYNKRIGTIDLLVCATIIEPNGSTLTSGTPADAIGAGRPALISDWPFLQEYMGDAGILYGLTAEDLIRCPEHIDQRRVQEATNAALELQPQLSWHRLAPFTLEVITEVIRLASSQRHSARKTEEHRAFGNNSRNFR
jgi:hypothetical protein